MSAFLQNGQAWLPLSTGKQIIVRADNGEYDTYDLIKFLRSNQSTCINQHPIVYKGDKVEVRAVHWQIGMSTDGGETGSRTQRACGVRILGRI